MARSPLTLAAAVASAVPDAVAVGVTALTENAAGRFDSASVRLSDGSRVVVRVATDDESAAELEAQRRALAALTDGVRAQLPFAVPVLRGHTALDGRPAIVVDLIRGYRVDAGQVPAGLGVATALGAAVAAVHALPVTVARDAGLAELSTAQVRAGVARLLDRVTVSRRVPVPLLSRWSRALAADRLWRFTSGLTLGGVATDAFVWEDVAGIPTLRGLLAWHGLGVGDPAIDLQWLSSAPHAADDVYDAYAAAGAHTPDPALRVRARLYAELEFARWLVHGDDLGRDDIVDDAVALLTTLGDTVGDDDLTVEPGPDVDDAIARLGDIPVAPTPGADTSMQTDAFTEADMAPFRDDDRAADGGVPTTPLEGITRWGFSGDEDAVADADRATQATLRRWTMPD